MASDPLGISFSPFNPQQQQGGAGGTAAPTPQDAIRILSFRPRARWAPRVRFLARCSMRLVGARSDRPAGTWNSCSRFSSARNGRGLMNGGVGGLPETPQPGPGLPWETQTGPTTAPLPGVRPGTGTERGTPTPPPAPFGGNETMPWDGPTMPERRIASSSDMGAQTKTRAATIAEAVPTTAGHWSVCRD
jgi:hypothetical protein